MNTEKPVIKFSPDTKLWVINYTGCQQPISVIVIRDVCIEICKDEARICTVVEGDPHPLEYVDGIFHVPEIKTPMCISDMKKFLHGFEMSPNGLSIFDLM